MLVLHEPNPMALLAYALARPRHRLIVWYHSEVLRPRWRYKLIYEPFLDLHSAARAHRRRHLRRCLEYAAPLGAASTAVRSHSVRPRPDARHATRKGTSRQSGPRAVAGPVALFVGRLVPYKGVDVLLRALAEVDVAAVIVGDGPLRESLAAPGRRARRRRPRTSFWPCGRRRCAAWYAACDVFVLPSVTRAEAFGLVQLEAMARGKPVISTVLRPACRGSTARPTGLTVTPG